MEWIWRLFRPFFAFPNTITSASTCVIIIRQKFLHTYIHSYIHRPTYMALRSKTNQKRWMALDWASYCHRMPQETVWSSAEIWMNQLSVFVERRPGFNEFQTKETEIEKARDAKAEETVGLWIWNCWWWMKDDFSCVAGCWFRRTSCYAENNIKCPALKAKKPYFEINLLSNEEPVKRASYQTRKHHGSSE